MLDLAKELRTFGSSVVHKRFHVLLETVNTIFHFAVKSLGSHKTLNHILMCREDLPILALDCSFALLQALVFLLIGSYSFVL